MKVANESLKSRVVRLCAVLVLFSAGGAWAAAESIAITMDPGGDQRGQVQVADYMKNDLKNVLERRGGYKARVLASAEEYKQGQGEYRLAVKILKYRPGVKAVRMFVGMGAGAASLDIHYEFVDPNGRALISKDDGVGTSVDWPRLARKLNENMLAAIQQKLGGGTGAAAEAAAPAGEKPVSNKP